MPRDLVVTTPKSEMAKAAEEAAWARRQRGGPRTLYFRRIGTVPKEAGTGSRLFYVEDGYVRGFCTLLGVDTDGSGYCDVTNRDWGEGPQLVMRADSWKWIVPIPLKGFQGWRYWPPNALLDNHICCPLIIVIGDWRAKRPVKCRSCDGTGECTMCGDDGEECSWCFGDGCPDCGGYGWVVPE